MNPAPDECRLFLSYKHDPHYDPVGVIQDTIDTLNLAAHISCRVVSDLDIAPGQKWRDEIIKSIKRCDVFCVVVPLDISTQVAVECGIALGLGKPILAFVLYDNVSALASYGLDHLQAVVYKDHQDDDRKVNFMVDMCNNMLRVICAAKHWKPIRLTSPLKEAYEE